MDPRFYTSLLSDDPLGRMDDVESFGRAQLVDRLTEVLGRVRAQSASSVLAVIGPWGSGKTTVLQELKRRLAEGVATGLGAGEAWSVAEFNPWLYSDTIALHGGFFEELRDALPRDERWKQTRKKIANLARRVAPLGGIGQFWGVDATGLVNGIVDEVQPSATRERQQVEQSMKAYAQPVLMILDDLDRLSADELVHVFKLVRLVGRLPNVYYVLSYDEHTLIDLLGKTDLVAADDKRRALDYLEKMVQVRVDVPMLREYEVDKLVSESLRHLATTHGLRIEEREWVTLLQRFDHVLSRRLRTPRAIKRLFGQLDAFLSAVGGEVSFTDFVTITWLRTMEPGVYGMLQSHKSELLERGRHSVRQRTSRPRTNRDARNLWEERLTRANVASPDVDDLVFVLSELFPALRDVYRADEKEFGSGGGVDPKPFRIAHPDYFDRYFAFGVTADDIADQTVAEAVRQLADNDHADAASRELGSHFDQHPELVLRKLHQVADIEAFDRRPLIQWLTSRYRNVSAYTSLSERIEYAVTRLFSDADVADLDRLVDELASSDSGLYLLAAVQHLLSSRQVNDRVTFERYQQAAAALEPLVVGRLRDRFAELPEQMQSPLDSSARIHGLVQLWNLIDPDGFRQFITEALDHNGWSILDVLAWLLSAGPDSAGELRISRFSDLTTSAGVLDLAQARALLKREIDTADFVAPDQWTEREATPENRRERVLNLLRGGQDAETD